MLYFIIWLAPRTGKINQIARCDWLPERARWSHLARSGLPAVSRKRNFTKSHIINPLLFGQDGWILDSFFFCEFKLWTSTLSRSIKTQKKNLANIQPSWSITHTCSYRYYRGITQGNKTIKITNIYVTFLHSQCLLQPLEGDHLSLPTPLVAYKNYSISGQLQFRTVFSGVRLQGLLL